MVVSLNSRLESHRREEDSAVLILFGARSFTQGYLAHKKQPPPPQGVHKIISIVLL